VPSGSAMRSQPAGQGGLEQSQQAIYGACKQEVADSRVDKIRHLLREEEAGQLLDVGCSSGAVSFPLLAEGWTVYGMDLWLPPLIQASASGIRAVIGNVAESLPFVSGTLDAVLAGEIIEHVVDTDALLIEIHRVLRPGGVLVLTTPNLASLDNRVRLLLGMYPKWVDYSLGEGQGHVGSYTPSVIRRQLGQHGFVVERHVGNIVPLFPQRVLNHLPEPWLARTGDWFPSLAMDIIVKARKKNPGWRGASA
jgi:SAM-dependent methyltransferase